ARLWVVLLRRVRDSRRELDLDRVDRTALLPATRDAARPRSGRRRTTGRSGCVATAARAVHRGLPIEVALGLLRPPVRNGRVLRPGAHDVRGRRTPAQRAPGDVRRGARLPPAGTGTSAQS